MKNLIKSTTGLALVLGLALLGTPSLASDADDMAKLGKEGNLVCDYCDLSAEDLTTYTNFFKASLRHAKFGSSVMNGMNMRGANLEGSDFVHAKLKNAIFTQATLKNVDFRNADLTGATFGGADLSGTRVDGANFTDANLTGATVDKDDYNHATICNTTAPNGEVVNRDCVD